MKWPSGVADEGGCLPADFASRYRTFSATEGSIVIALTRTIIAAGLKAAVVPASYDQALVNQRVASITADTQRVTRDFLFVYLRTGRVLRYVQACVNTLMQPNLSIVDLRRLPVPVPTVVAQQRFSESHSLLDEQVESLIEVYHQKVAALDELKRSLLHQAFTGGLS